jgi:hypothetical protein
MDSAPSLTSLQKRQGEKTGPDHPAQDDSPHGRAEQHGADAEQDEAQGNA